MCKDAVPAIPAQVPTRYIELPMCIARRWSAMALTASSLGTILAPHSASAQTSDTVFARRQPINMYIGYAPGGSYDLYGRLLARHLTKHLPNQPPVLPQNMPGAGSLQAANFLYGVAPKDGTAIAVVAETIPLEQALKNPGVQYDALKFTYLGRIASSNNVHLVWHTAKAQSVADTLHTEMAVAGTGPANIAEIIPKLLNAIEGTKFKVISGYPSSGPAMLAMERGELDGTGTSWAIVKAQKQDWLNLKKVKIILQVLPERSAELPQVPALGEYGKTAEDKQILRLYASGGALGRYVVAAPDLATDVAKALRDGFEKTMKDPEFLAECAKANLDVDPAPHEKLLEVARRTLDVSDAIRLRVREIFKQ